MQSNPGEAFATATSGTASTIPYRAQMESAFGRSFSGVQAYLGGTPATAGLDSLGAEAAAHGNQVAFRDASPSQHLVAHELAHVVQQSSGGGGVQCKPSAVSNPGDAAEQRADAAAIAVVRGEPVPDVGSAPAGAIHCATLRTYGGEFTTDGASAVGRPRTYQRAPVGETGVDFLVSFIPGELVECPSIGLTQTANSQQGTAAAPTVNSPFFFGGAARQQEVRRRSLTAAQEGGGNPGGRHVDRAAENINPIYPTQNPTDAAGNVDDHAALTASPTTNFWGQHGHRNKRPDGTFDVQEAVLDDKPRLAPPPGTTCAQTFETTAVCMSGDMAGTYLGSISWGYDQDAAGNINVHPLSIVSMGVPSSAYMSAARLWNNDTTNVGGVARQNLALPATDHQTADPASLSDQDLERRMRELHERMRGMREADDPTTYRNIQFEIRGLGREAVRRAGSVRDSGHTLAAVHGDTLWGLASRHLGSGALWVRIFALNCVDMRNGDVLATGATLKMPEPFRPAGP